MKDSQRQRDLAAQQTDAQNRTLRDKLIREEQSKPENRLRAALSAIGLFVVLVVVGTWLLWSGVI